MWLDCYFFACWHSESSSGSGYRGCKNQFSDVSWRSAYGIASTFFATAFAGVLFAAGKVVFQKSTLYTWGTNETRNIAQPTNHR